MKLENRWLNGSGLVALLLYLAGMALLLFPVVSHVPADGQQAAEFGKYSHLCGLTVTSALHAQRDSPSGDDDRASDCARKAEHRFGYGLLLVLGSLPVAAVTLGTRDR